MTSLTIYNCWSLAEAIRLDDDLYASLTAETHFGNNRYEWEIHDPPGATPDGYFGSIWTETFDDRAGYL